MTVVLVGDANVDLLVRLPGADGVLSEPILHGGGTSANTAVALARLGVPVAFVGMVGDDGYGRTIQAELAAEGVDTGGLRAHASAFTPMVLAMIQPDGERHLIVWPPHGGADKQLRPDDLDPVQIAGATWLHTTGMVLRDAPVREAALHAMQLARTAGVPVSLDLNLRLELWGWEDGIRATLDRALALADVVFGSAAEEIVPLAGTGAVKTAAATLAAGQRTVVARLGSEGGLAAAPSGEVVRMPAFPTTVVDTLGAGDAFDAGFITARIAGLGLRDALRWGNAVAALKIAHPGGRGTPTRAEVERLLAKYPDL